ncbi:AGL314Cp [Eremothecium gossypii ATCC 10895]|uniref:Ubiquitin carboxyl-terminal hydrolase n=1 Tax=Eremothecium gossypii (strain ATCC 10895 / CBS 109.51 / FGSC 9923 / NRRL Y-1056) TaxID=284811 RepID=Q751L5_EREGS|nr:AGL314Cp [Eremothecium gossypii ATCC 10895]AAS54177.1 AGL314Cp [Eremothecium gossypii ATCC 10895]AEY98503.1 FAGL314Cp [Eremothecium gossypii FDAG1]
MACCPDSVTPLESSPEVFTDFAHALGLQSDMAFHDIYSLTDPDMLAFLSRPMKSVILLFPLNAFFRELICPEYHGGDKSPIWFKQTIRNACGMYALLHSLANNRELVMQDSPLDRFLAQNPSADGRYDDQNTVDFLVANGELYQRSSLQGQTEAPDPEEEVELHFITFLVSGGQVFELDGRGKGPYLLGAASDGDVLEQPLVKDRIQWFMDNADDEAKNQFSLLGLGPSWK